MSITPDNYLDFGNLFINEIVGDAMLALILGVIIIIFISLKYRVDFKATTGLILLFVVGMGGYLYNQLAIALAIMFVGVIGYGTYAKMITKT